MTLGTSTTNQTTSNTRTESTRWVQLLSLFELVFAGAAIIFGGIVIISQIVAFVQGLLGIPISAAYSSWFTQGLISLVLGLIGVSIGTNILERELWPFSTCLYVNSILTVVYLTLPYPLSVAFLIFALIPIVLLFHPEIRAFWFPSFREDMTPRIKELRHGLYLVKKSPLVVVGLIIIAAFVFLAFAAPWLAPYGPEERIWADSNLPPMSPSTRPNAPMHYWGTDDSGGDIFSRILWAAQVDLRISITVVAVAVIVGVLIGSIAGYFGGIVDELVMRVTDIFFAFPGLVLAMAIVMAVGQRNMDSIAIALIVTWWPVYARLVRGQVLSEREKLYVEAARSVGARDSRIILFHIIPNTIQPLIVQATMDTGAVLLTAAGLAFIGFGPPAGVAEWGYMISIGQYYFTSNVWPVFFPGMAILLVSLAFNLAGDGIRDILDPKLRRR